MRLDHITPKGLLLSIPIYSKTKEISKSGCVVTAQPTSSPGDNSKWVPPDPLSNSEVKPLSADDSVGSPHVKVGHRRGIKKSERPPCFLGWPFCFLGSGNEVLLHGKPCDKIVGNILNCGTQARRVEARMPGVK